MNNSLNFIPDNYDDLFDWLSTFRAIFQPQNYMGQLLVHYVEECD